MRAARRRTTTVWAPLLVAAAALIAPAAAHAQAYVSQALHDAAVAAPDATFNLVVQGTERVTARRVAQDVQEEEDHEPGDEAGVRRRFVSIGAVAAQLTGRQLLALARNDRILAITSDVPLRPSLDLPPASTAAPVVTGTAEVGRMLSADTGTWAGVEPIAYAYQWQRCSATCSDIAGAVAATYDVGADDVGATLTVVVTATDVGGSTAAVAGPTAPVSGPPLAPPSNLEPPLLEGSVVEGSTLSASTGLWASGSPLSYGYRWQRCSAAGDACADVAGSTEPTYLLGAADVGSTIRVSVTATVAAGSATAASAPTAAVAPAQTAPVAAAAPVLVGPATVGATVRVANGVWTGLAPIAFAYRWQRCNEVGEACTDLLAAADDAYVPVPDDAGSTLRVVVVATNARGTTSVATGPTERIAPVTTSGFWSWQVGPYAVRADAVWEVAAEPPAIAVVDSGVDGTLPGLAVEQQVTLTSLPQRAVADGYGHGSFVAAVAAGRAAGEAGAAPRARIVSLDVMNDSGMALTSDVIAAADWIYNHEDELRIGVANFSLLSSSPSSIRFDPLDRALERLWFSGVVVVTASGNYAQDGRPSDVAFAPANDPFLLTVGAADVRTTVPVVDDLAAPWSVYGYTPDGFAKPELGAPGRYVVAPVPTDSTLYTSRPDRIVSAGRMQLSGTSFAAPVVAGIAAGLLAVHPEWTPDQVKGALMLGAATLPVAAPSSLGVGEVDAAAALATVDPPNPNAALDAFLVADPAGGPTPVFDAASWGTAARADASWATASWGTASWGTASWGTASWGTTYWSSASWGTASWGTASWGTASWGTSAVAVDNALADFRASAADPVRWRP